MVAVHSVTVNKVDIVNMKVIAPSITRMLRVSRFFLKKILG